jgi:uncharacterized membrane protein
MDPTSSIALWAALFVITHLGMTARSIRPNLVRMLGNGPYLLVYSLISFGTFIPLTIAFFSAKHSGPMLWYLRDLEPVRWLTISLMVVGLVVTAGAFITPSPAGLAPNTTFEPRGMLKITRHPLFVGIAIFGIAHMLMNGWLGDLLYFGTFPAVSIVGAWHQDQRKLADMGEEYRAFYQSTSFVPGAALIDGRQHFSLPDLSFPALVLGAVLVVALLFAHPHVFGGRPLG